MQKPIILITGPTTSGKTALAIEVAKRIEAEVINADAMQVYAEIPKITAQPTREEQKGVPHHLFGVLPASELCSVARWLELAIPLIDDIRSRGKIPMLVGGTGMYITSLLKGIHPVPAISEEVRATTREHLKNIGNEAFHAELRQKDPVAAERLFSGDTQRILRAYEVVAQTGVPLATWQERQTRTIFYPESEFMPFVLAPERAVLYERCNIRFDQMIEQGVIEEITALAEQNLSPALPAMKAHGVPELMSYIRGDCSLEEAKDKAKQHTRNYVKRQFTWCSHQLPDAVRLTHPDHELIVKTITNHL